jgi:ribosomal protein L31
MTRPSDIKPREGEQAGTPYAGFEVGAVLPEMAFELTPDIVAEYARAIDVEDAPMRIDGRTVAPATVLMPYMAAIVYRRYPPIQGIIMVDVTLKLSHPIWADETTAVRAHGRILEKFEKRGRYYVRWEAEYARADGQALATLVNTFSVPE